MKRLLFIFVFITFQVFAKTLPMSDFIKSKIKLFVNIDKDFATEAIVTKLYKSKDNTDFYKIVVLDDNNQILAQSREVDKINDINFVGESDFGISMPQVVADVDGNKKMDIIVPYPQSDVSPTYYKAFEIKDKKLKVKELKALIKDKNGKFVWRSVEGKYKGVTWVMEFKKSLSKNIVLSEVYFWKSDDVMERGLALLKLKKGGAKLLKWKIPMHDIAKNEYIAVISKKDKYNSKGKKLTTVRSILIQDRANYHNNRCSEGEEGLIFKTAKERLKIKKSWIIPVNRTLSELKDEIINSNPVLSVTVLGNKLYIYVVDKFDL